MTRFATAAALVLLAAPAQASDACETLREALQYQNGTVAADAVAIVSLALITSDQPELERWRADRLDVLQERQRKVDELIEAWRANC